MNRQRRSIAILIVAGLLCVLSVGCAAFEMRGAHPVYATSLSAKEKLELVQFRMANAILTGGKHNYTELQLLLQSEDGIDLSYPVGRADGTWREPADFKLGRLEARCDETGQRVWIVDRDAEQVVATLDREARSVTGLDDAHPAWATPHGGKLMEPAPVD